MADETPNERLDQFRRAIKQSVQIHEGNQVVPLIDGKETFQAMYNAIQKVLSRPNDRTAYIYLLAWSLDDTFELVKGQKDSSIQKLFEAASEIGVQVRVMLWLDPRQLIDAANPFHNFLQSEWQKGQKLREVLEGGPIIKRINLLKNGAGILDELTLPLPPKSQLRPRARVYGLSEFTHYPVGTRHP